LLFFVAPHAPTPGVPPGVVGGGWGGPPAPPRRRLRTELSFADDEVVALFVGGDWARKGLHVAIEGIARAKAGGASSLRLCVVGRGDERRLSALARMLGVEDAVTFVGARSDTERFYKAADVFVLPTLYEAFSLVMLEALAAGLPIVTTRVNGVDELFAGQQPGLIVHRTPDDVARALAELAESPGLRAEMGRSARAIASRFTWERSAEGMLDIFAELAATAPAASARVSRAEAV
jgi:UDP-glucose:(heptosyl)LPS alpha-1,3-glucosyltransferase